MKKTLKIIKNLLLIFVFVSIGYALGKHSFSKKNAGNLMTGEIKNAPGREFTVYVYYMHSTFRCVTCNTIEKMTKQLLDSSFKKELEVGLIKFKDVDFQENEKLAKQFDIVSSCVVVAKSENGKIVNFKRLDEVWTLMSDQSKFDDYLSQAILAYLNRSEKRKGSVP